MQRTPKTVNSLSHITDHLGNVRATFKGNTAGQPVLMQTTDYYPFGLSVKRVGVISLSYPNEYLYQGKEMDNENGLNWYDFHARLYDPVLGRWHSPDPAQQYVSPYMAMGNNPVNVIDPNGMNDDPWWKKFRNWWQRMWDNPVEGSNLGKRRLELATNPQYMTPGGEGNDSGILGGGYGNGFGGSGGGGSNSSSNNALASLNGLTPGLAPNPYKTVSRGSNSGGGITVPYIFNGMETTQQAISHYLNGNGEPITLGNNTISALILSDEFQIHHNNIVTGQTRRTVGDFSVNMTLSVFHVGKTNVKYSISCADGNCTVVYTMFTDDGFWDPDYLNEVYYWKLWNLPSMKPDGLRPLYEILGGTPYPYVPVIGTFTFPNPGY